MIFHCHIRSGGSRACLRAVRLCRPVLPQSPGAARRPFA
jgi:hypothetical protein